MRNSSIMSLIHVGKVFLWLNVSATLLSYVPLCCSFVNVVSWKKKFMHDSYNRGNSLLKEGKQDVEDEKERKKT